MAKAFKAYLWVYFVFGAIQLLLFVMTRQSPYHEVELHTLIAASALAIIYTIEGYKLNTTVTIKYKNEDEEPEVRDE